MIACSTAERAEMPAPRAMFSAFARNSLSAWRDETAAISTAVSVAIATKTAASHQRIPIRAPLTLEVSACLRPFRQRVCADLHAMLIPD